MIPRSYGILHSCVSFMNNRTVLKYHSWLGLIVGLFVFLMGVSGAILVFQHDIEDALWEDYIQIKDYQSLEIDRAVSTIQEEYPGWDTRLMHFEEEEALIFNLRKPTERLFVFVHPTSGEIIEEINELTTFTRWLLKFHYSFQAGPAGRMLVFTIGILFLLSLISGIYVYRKSILQTFFLRTRINRKTERTFYSSLHRNVGVWALLLNLLLVITGLFLAYKVTLSGLNPPKAPETPEVTAPIKMVLREIETDYPDFKATYVRLPLNEEGTIKVYGLYEDDPFYYSEFYNSFLADYRTGTITGIIKNREADFSTKFSSTLIPLHFGQFGGIWSKLLYSFIGLSGPFLSITGFLIWRKGRKKQKKMDKKKKFSTSA